MDKGRKLFIGGLAVNVRKEELEHELNKFGDVANIWVARNPPGFAFVEYRKAFDAEKAVRALDGMSLSGSRIRVEFSHSDGKGTGNGSASSRRHGSPSPRQPQFSGGNGGGRRNDSYLRRGGEMYNDNFNGNGSRRDNQLSNQGGGINAHPPFHRSSTDILSTLQNSVTGGGLSARLSIDQLAALYQANPELATAAAAAALANGLSGGAGAAAAAALGGALQPQHPHRHGNGGGLSGSLLPPSAEELLRNLAQQFANGGLGSQSNNFGGGLGGLSCLDGSAGLSSVGGGQSRRRSPGRDKRGGSPGDMRWRGRSRSPIERFSRADRDPGHRDRDRHRRDNIDREHGDRDERFGSGTRPTADSSIAPLGLPGYQSGSLMSGMGGGRFAGGAPGTLLGSHHSLQQHQGAVLSNFTGRNNNVGGSMLTMPHHQMLSGEFGDTIAGGNHSRNQRAVRRSVTPPISRNTALLAPPSMPFALMPTPLMGVPTGEDRQRRRAVDRLGSRRGGGGTDRNTDRTRSRSRQQLDLDTSDSSRKSRGGGRRRSRGRRESLDQRQREYEAPPMPPMNSIASQDGKHMRDNSNRRTGGGGGSGTGRSTGTSRRSSKGSMAGGGSASKDHRRSHGSDRSGSSRRGRDKRGHRDRRR